MSNADQNELEKAAAQFTFKTANLLPPDASEDDARGVLYRFHYHCAAHVPILLLKISDGAESEKARQMALAIHDTRFKMGIDPLVQNACSLGRCRPRPIESDLEFAMLHRKIESRLEESALYGMALLWLLNGRSETLSRWIMGRMPKSEEMEKRLGYFTLHIDCRSEFADSIMKMFVAESYGFSIPRIMEIVELALEDSVSLTKMIFRTR